MALVFTSLELWAQTPPNLPIGSGQTTLPRYPQAAQTTTSYAAPVDATKPDEIMPAGYIDFEGVDVGVVLDIYAKLEGRTLLRGPLPAAQIILHTQTALTKSEVIEALQAVLGINGIVVVNIGDKFVKVLPSDQAGGAGGSLDSTSATNLPNLGTYTTYIRQLRYVKPSVIAPLIAGFGKLPGNLFPIDDNGILVMRDYAENIKRMLEMIDKIDVSVPAEYVSEVIPIRYAKVDDIASALNALGGSGGSTVSIGNSPSAAPINGMRGTTTGLNGLGAAGSTGGVGGGLGGLGGGTSAYGAQPRTTGAANPNGTPTAGTTFTQRLNNIINRTSGGGSGADQPITLFGQTKIIPDESSSSLLIYATRQDMEVIKGIIAKLDVPLAQVLIESIIMDVDIGKSVNAGVSVVQQPKQFNNSNVTGGGAMINGSGSFLNTVQNLVTNGSGAGVINSSSLPTNALSSGLNYFGNIGDTWNILVQAAQSDNTAHIIQRPRIQTSQAVPAQFFVGQSVPYVNSTYNNSINGGYGGSSYSQLNVGVELDVTPFINPDGLVVMQINQEIDDISGYTSIDGNQVPNTDKRTLNSTISVRNRDTVILGGFVRAQKSQANSGVPILMDIPLLGWLFRSTASTKDHSELMVLMRPTVLKTPFLAAVETIKEGQRLPEVSAAVAEEAEENRKLIDVERKKELKSATNGAPADGFYNMNPNAMDTNTPAGDLGTGLPPDTTVPANPSTNQDKARAVLEQQMKALDAQPAPNSPPPQ
jgi:general secretion pathway protein D